MKVERALPLAVRSLDQALIVLVSTMHSRGPAQDAVKDAAAQAQQGTAAAAAEESAAAGEEDAPASTSGQPSPVPAADPGMIVPGLARGSSEAARFEAQKERKAALQAVLSQFNRCVMKGCIHWLCPFRWWHSAACTGSPGCLQGAQLAACRAALLRPSACRPPA